MSYIKRQKGLNGVGAVVEDDIASYMQKLPPIAGRGRTGLSSFVSTSGGYVRTGLGAAITQSEADKIAKRLYFISNTWSLVIKEAKDISPEKRSLVYQTLRLAMKKSPYFDKSSGAFVDRLTKAVPPGPDPSLAKPVKSSVFTATAAVRAGIAKGFTMAAKAERPSIQVGITKAQRDVMSPEEQAAYDAKQKAAAAAFEQARANAPRIVDRSDGTPKYVRDNTPEGLKAQAEGRLQTIESGGSGILTPPTPEQAASPTPVTPDGTQPLAPVGGGLLSGKLPWIIGGGIALLGLVLLTRKKKTH